MIENEPYVTIKEANFNLEIRSFDDLTLDLLKKYADYKCNGHEKFDKEKPKLEVPSTVPSNLPETIPGKVPEKVCSKCEISKPLADFNKSKKEKLGVQNTCRICQREYNRDYLLKKATISSNSKQYKKQTAVQKEANSLSKAMMHNSDGGEWDTTEEDIVRRNYPKFGADGIITILKNRSKIDIDNKAKKMGLSCIELSVKSPNTSLFLNWLANTKARVFDIRDFVKDNSTITLDQAKNIVAHQIMKNKLQQLSKTEFKVA